MIKTILMLAATAAMLFTSTAYSADMPVKYAKETVQVAAYNWTGLYAGINAGYGNSYDKTTVRGGNTLSNTIVATGAVPGVMDTHADGWTFGGQIGYNWQFQQLVLGIETDLQWSDAKGRASQNLTLAPVIPALPLGISATATTEREWFGTLRGKVGLAIDRSLFYFTGGLAYAKIDQTASASLIAPAPFGASAASSVSKTETGWVVGGGFEYALFPNWRLKAEYLYSDYGDISGAYGTRVFGAPVGFVATTPAKYHDLRAGLNYAF